MRLVLLRHGITAWNLEKRIQGRIDQPLNDAGRQQLRALTVPDDYLDDRWYCSPLRRAVASAELLALRNVVIEPALIEMDWGDWEGEVLKPLRKRIGEPMRTNERRGLDFRPPGGESPRLVQARLQPWLRQIAASGVNSGAVAHKGIIRCIYALACHWDMCGETPVEFAWDALHQFELNSDGTLLNRYDPIPLLKRP
ncbi:MAG: histidine phosphatase family protein [Gammaproteobacteria bacterium]|nr:histidine phosphatase family protein [Gammaproteobacteria bacterium]